MEIKRLTLKTVLNFGMHKGKTVEEVLLGNSPSYILIFCITKADYFVEGLKEYIDQAEKEMDNRNYLHYTYENDPRHLHPVAVAGLKYRSLFNEIKKMEKGNTTLEDVFKHNEEKKKMYLNEMEERRQERKNRRRVNEDYDNGPGAYGYSSWEELNLREGFDGNVELYRDNDF